MLSQIWDFDINQLASFKVFSGAHIKNGFLFDAIVEDHL
jgi:hypothetical protein